MRTGLESSRRGRTGASKDPAVYAHELCRSFDNKEVLSKLNFEIKQGEVFGFVGPDGAGKTTIMQILSGILSASSGEVKVLGKNTGESRKETSYLSQQFTLYPELSVEENLRYIAGIHDIGKSRFDEHEKTYLTQLGLYQFRDRPSSQLSGGMKQKLSLCAALISAPKIILMDEPSAGVDPVSRREIWELILQARDETGVTVVLSTPYWDEGEYCDRLALLNDGKIEVTGSPKDLKKHLNLLRLELYAESIEASEAICADLLKAKAALISDATTVGSRIDLLLKEKHSSADEIRSYLLESGAAIQRGVAGEPTIEDVFFMHMKSHHERVEAPVEKAPICTRRTKDSGPDALKAEHLKKAFGSFIAVEDFSLDLKFGEIYGLLGANGAGKTTTIRMLCGLLQPSQGQVKLLGQRSGTNSKLRKRIGYMSQKSTLYADLTVKENLELFCGLYEIPWQDRNKRIDWVLAACGLEEHRDQLVASLPRGWKQRVAFGSALMHSPELIFLDEPSSGVDPLARRELWHLIRYLARNGAAILLTTHFLDEAEYCNRLAVMVSGRTIVESSPADFKARAGENKIEDAFIKLVKNEASPQSAEERK